MRAPGTPLTRDDFAVGPESLARRLLGCVLVRTLADGTRLGGRIVETEAYCGRDDLAAHSAGGRRTARNEPMYAPPGTAYVFFTYGMHHCFNVVCGRAGEPVAVLIRALEPAEGVDIMRRNRAAARKSPPERAVPDRELCSGPARLCQALAIDRALNGVDIPSNPGIAVEFGPDGPISDRDVVNDARVGVAYAGEWAAAPLRWHIRGNPHVSVVRTVR